MKTSSFHFLFIKLSVYLNRPVFVMNDFFSFTSDTISSQNAYFGLPDLGTV